MKHLRHNTWKFLSRLGLLTNPSLPLLNMNNIIRSNSDIVDRILCFHAAAAGAYGFPKASAMKWLTEENLIHAILQPEIDFLDNGLGDVTQFKLQIESMWALSWCLKILPTDLNVTEPCSPSFAGMLPNLKAMETQADFRKKCTLRANTEIIPVLDLYYCAHWSLTEMSLQKTKIPKKIIPWIILYRRKAFEWLYSDEQWYELSLDT